MATNNAPSPSLFAIALRDYRTRQGLKRVELATCMIVRGFPAYLYSHQPGGSHADVAFLARRIRDIEVSDSQGIWPFPAREADFIDTAASCLPNILLAQSRLMQVMALDALAQGDP
jgi:hypothetical protein